MPVTSYEAIYGSMVNTNVGEILRNLMLFRENGILSMNHEGVAKSLFIKNGALVTATSNQDSESLLHYYADKGMISDQYLRTLKRLQRRGISEEAILVSKRICHASDIYPLKKEYSRTISTSLFRWNIGAYRYIFNAFPSPRTLCTEVPLAAIIMEGVSYIEDEELLMRWLGNLNAVPELNMKNSAMNSLRLDAHQGYVLSRIDGNTNLRQLGSMCGPDRFATYKTLYGAFLADIVQFDEDFVLMRDYAFDLEAEKEGAFRVVKPSMLNKDDFDLRAGDIVDEDEILIVTKDGEKRLDELFDTELTVDDIAELEEQMTEEMFKPQKLPLNEKGLEIRYKLWQAYQMKKESDKRAERQAKGMSGSSGSIELVGGKASEVMKMKNDISRLHRQLKSGTHYDVLEVEPDAKGTEIVEAYRSQKRKYDPEKWSMNELGSYYSMLVAISEALEAAWEVLQDPEKRKEYDQNIAETLARLEEQRQKKKAMADDKFRQGMEDLQRSEAVRAMDLFRSAISLYPEDPAYHERMALTLARNKKWYRDAVRILRNAINIDPENSRYYVLMGNISKVHGHKNAAVRAYRRASKLDPANHRLLQEIKELLVGGSGQPTPRR